MIELKRGDALEFIQRDPDFMCAYKGQHGTVLRPMENGQFYSILRCGHPYIIKQADINTLIKVTNRSIEVESLTNQEETNTSDGDGFDRTSTPVSVRAPGPTLGLPQPTGIEEIVMANKKQSVIPNGTATIHVQGYEKEVDSLKLNHAYLKNLAEQVDTQKVTFRQLAVQSAKSADGARRVEFLSKTGAVVAIGLPDYHEASARTNITDKAAKAAAKLGFDISEMGITEQVDTYKLTGEFVAVMDALIAREFTAKGLPIPAGIERSSARKLSLEGFQKLEAMAKEAKTEQEREAAEMLLDAGLKAATVTVE
jgi:hypothetical protein